MNVDERLTLTCICIVLASTILVVGIYIPWVAFEATSYNYEEGEIEASPPAGAQASRAQGVEHATGGILQIVPPHGEMISAGAKRSESATGQNDELATVPGRSELAPVWVSMHRLYKQKAQLSKKVDVVLFGDSLIQYWHVVDGTGGMKAMVDLRRRTGLEILSFGIAGDSIARLKWRIDHGELPPDPKVVVICTGRMDLLQGVPTDVETVAKQVVDLAAEVKRMRPKAEVLIHGLLPESLSVGAAADPVPLSFNRIIEQSLPVDLKFMDCGYYFMNPSTGELKKQHYAAEKSRYFLLSPAGYQALSQCLEQYFIATIQ